MLGDDGGGGVGGGKIEGMSGLVLLVVSSSKY